MASALGAPHHDTDDYLWIPTDPSYRQRRPLNERLRLMDAIFVLRPDWVLSGSLDEWNSGLDTLYDLVVFVQTPTDVRLARLRDRESRRLRTDTLPPDAEDFLEWASHYDDGERDGRNIVRHLAWLDTLSCPVLGLDGTRPVEDLTAEVLAAL